MMGNDSRPAGGQLTFVKELGLRLLRFSRIE